MRQRGVAEAPAAEFAAYSQDGRRRTDDSKIITWMDESSEDELVLACALKIIPICVSVATVTDGSKQAHSAY